MPDPHRPDSAQTEPPRAELDEQEFRLRYDSALSALYRSLLSAAEEHDFETDLSNGTLTVEFEEPRAKFVVSPQAPTRQVWISAHSRSFKLDWRAEASEFRLADTGQSLKAVLQEQVSRQLGGEIRLP